MQTAQIAQAVFHASHKITVQTVISAHVSLHVEFIGYTAFLFSDQESTTRGSPQPLGLVFAFNLVHVCLVPAGSSYFTVQGKS